MKHILFRAPLFIALMVLLMTTFAKVALADGVSTDSATRTEVVCDVGSYGQRNCQEITRVIPIHQPVNSGIADMNWMVGVLALVAVGSTYGAMKIIKQ